MTPVVWEDAAQYDLTDAELARLLEMGLVCESPDHEGVYDVTAVVWNDLGIEGDRCFVLFDLILGRETA